MDYKNRYLKYKSKYLKLKESIYPSSINMIGGGKVFTNETTLYIIANLDDTRSNQGFSERTNVLLSGNRPFQPPHVTVHSLDINQDNPYAKLFQDQGFYDVVKKSFEYNLGGQGGLFGPKSLKLKSPMGQYTLFGVKPKYFGRRYTPDNQDAITNFRLELYKYIESQLGGKLTSRIEIKNNMTYHIYSYNGVDLYSVSDYYYGKGVWSPHISIVNEFDIQNNNKQLYAEYLSKQTDDDKRDLLVSKVQGQRVTPLSEIDFNEVNTITVSIKNKGAGISIDQKIRVK